MPLAGGDIMGLHQPLSEKGHGRNRACEKNQQGFTSSGGSQVPIPKSPGKHRCSSQRMWEVKKKKPDRIKLI